MGGSGAENYASRDVESATARRVAGLGGGDRLGLEPRNLALDPAGVPEAEPNVAPL